MPVSNQVFYEDLSYTSKVSHSTKRSYKETSTVSQEQAMKAQKVKTEKVRTEKEGDGPSKPKKVAQEGQPLSEAQLKKVEKMAAALKGIAEKLEEKLAKAESDGLDSHMPPQMRPKALAFRAELEIELAELGVALETKTGAFAALTGKQKETKQQGKNLTNLLQQTLECAEAFRGTH